MDNPTQNDHDLLIELRTEMRNLRQDIKNISEGIGDTVKDHESRIRLIETFKENLMGKMVVGTFLVSIFVTGLLSLVTALARKYLGL